MRPGARERAGRGRGVPSPRGVRVAGVILAAGRSTRMGAVNKLLAEVKGVPIVRRVTRTVLDAALDPVVVVLGHDADAVRRALDGLPVRFVVNPEHETGIGSSVRAGVRAVATVEGAMIVLGDMPWLAVPDLRALVGAFAPGEGRGICAPVAGGRRGNPVLWGARYFPELRALEGDVGGRRLLAEHAEDVHEVPVAGDGVVADVDTPEALDAARAGGR